MPRSASCLRAPRSRSSACDLRGGVLRRPVQGAATVGATVAAAVAAAVAVTLGAAALGAVALAAAALVAAALTLAASAATSAVHQGSFAATCAARRQRDA
eukprot:scaffold36782_cov66-Phaeocystis_antarctica.AAC.6